MHWPLLAADSSHSTQIRPFFEPSGRKFESLRACDQISTADSRASMVASSAHILHAGSGVSQRRERRAAPLHKELVEHRDPHTEKLPSLDYQVAGVE